MKVKGTILTSIQGFVKENFPNRHQEWIDALPVESKSLYTNSFMASEWYSYQDGLIKPTELLAKLFYNSDLKKSSWDIGRYSAEVGLKGIYKVFILIATPQFIMKRAGKILSSFYDPSVLILGDERPKGVDVHITEFSDPSEIAENRIAGWIEKALEICGEKNISVDITKSLTKGDDKTVLVVDWG
ncbi:MAG: hypothetical protein KAQ62_26680 [Cyclobacteriaceae bacterium]|nr:hypothetical protein [Cyclobacteriaceae bacterium]MCK5372187.1 hypothetical protein [Cyclobacteriaceae bacterium]